MRWKEVTRAESRLERWETRWTQMRTITLSQIQIQIHEYISQIHYDYRLERKKRINWMKLKSIPVRNCIELFPLILGLPFNVCWYIWQYHHVYFEVP